MILFILVIILLVLIIFLFKKGENEGIVGNIIGKKETGSLRTLDSKSDDVYLTVNARVEAHPDTLVEIVKEEVERVFSAVGYKQEKLKCTYSWTTKSYI